MLRLAGMVACGFCLLSLTACPSGNVIATRPTPNGEVLILSADNRAVIFNKRNNKTCAEPQPDAIRAVAQELATALEASVPLGGAITPEAALALSYAMRESTAELGKRTPTIQLMRDLLYRACEAVMNGVIAARPSGSQPPPGSAYLTDGEAKQAKEDAVLTIVKQLDNMALGLHAIDGLTGMGKVATTVISSPTSGEVKASLSGGGAAPSAGLTAAAVLTEGEGLNKEAAEAIARAVVEALIVVLEEKNTYRVTDKW